MPIAQHVVLGGEADEAVVLDVGAVAVDAGLDRLAGLGMAAELARQGEQRQRGLEVELGGIEIGRQRGALERLAMAALDVGPVRPPLEQHLLIGGRIDADQALLELGVALFGLPP